MEDILYGADVTVLARLPYDAADPLCRRMKDLSGGAVSPEVSGPVLLGE